MTKKANTSIILTHRGLEKNEDFRFFESSLEAFKDHLSRGFGIEFDFNLTLDKKIIIMHDKTLLRITGGRDARMVQSVLSEELKVLKLNGNRLCLFDELMLEIIKRNTKLNAFHIKGAFQKEEYLDILLKSLKPYGANVKRLILFDLLPHAAEYLLKRNPHLILAPSVAHPFDINRYNQCVSGSLISINDAIKYKNLYKWVWLDEWDLVNVNGTTKRLYTKETFEQLKNIGYQIALVTPELHATSPGLLGNESHPDADPPKRLFRRISEIMDLQPDAICTDYPEVVKSMLP